MRHLQSTNQRAIRMKRDAFYANLNSVIQLSNQNGYTSFC